MEADGTWIALLLGALALLQSVLAAVQTWEHRRFARSRLRGIDRRKATGRALIVAPCKGLEVGLERSLRALFDQDYPDYEIAFVVESADDPAHELICRLMAEHSDKPSRLIVAGLATDSGQKVHNLQVATARLSAEVDYLAFVDSDAQPARHWLRTLASGLEHEGVGATTGYRWFLPVRRSLAQRWLAAINASVATAASLKGPNLVWGGSWAIRRNLFRQINLSQAWENTLSDDLVATRELRRRGLHIRFEPACVVASPAAGEPRQIVSFVRRQYIILRHYLPRWWLFALASGALANLGFWGNLFVGLWATATGQSIGYWLLGCAALLYTLYVFRVSLSHQIGRLYFPGLRQQRHASGVVELGLGPLLSATHWLVVLWSATTRTIRWRGIAYRLSPGGKIEILDRCPEPSRQTSETHKPTGNEALRPSRTGAFRKAG